MNHTTGECRLGTNKCKWCGSPDRSIAATPKRQKGIAKCVARPLAFPCQGALPPKPEIARQAYRMSKKEATISSMIVLVLSF